MLEQQRFALRTPPENSQRAQPFFYVWKMKNDLIAKSAIEKKLLEMINPIITDMGV